MKTFIKEFKYAFYLTVHPFKGFWEIKHENSGSIKTGIAILAFFVIACVSNGLYTGYLFNSNNGVNFNILKTVGMILIIFISWCIVNWCLTCLFDGEGNFNDILRATSYALLPMVFIQLLLIPVSNVLSVREAAFYSFIYTIGTIWMGFLIFSSVLVTHQYTFFKTVLMIVCIILGMCALVYIALLFFNLIQQMAGFIEVLTKEIQSNI